MRKLACLITGIVILLSTRGIAQHKHEVTGKIIDSTGNPVPFVTVKVKSTTTTVSANENGSFSIDAKIDDILVVTGVGLQTKEVKVTNTSELIIPVVRLSENLSEVVVNTALGIKRESRSLGYSTATLNSETINISRPINPVQSLVGEVSGAQVSIINNGVDPQIRVILRGERHLFDDNQPLYIVDGMEVNPDYVFTINPEDIDNISVLKGASSAALYGSEASNGVIVITTRRGSKNGKPSISFSQTTTVERISYLPPLQKQFGAYGNETGIFFAGTPYQLNAINPYTGFPNNIPFENQSYGPAFSGTPYFIGVPNQNGRVDSVPYAAQSKNIIQQFMISGITNQTDLSVSTGDAQNSNFLGVQYVKVTGVVPDDESQRASVRLAGKKTYGKFYYDYSISYSHKYTNVVGNDITYGWPIYWTLLNTPANIPIRALKDWQSPDSWGNLNNYYNAFYINPYWQIANSRNITKQDNVQGVVSLNLKPASWIDLTYRISAQVTNTVYEGYRNAALFSPWAIANPVYAITGGTPSFGSIPGAVVNETLLSKRIQQDVIATFSHKFGTDILAKLLVGNTIWDRFSNTQEQWVGNNVGSINGAPIVSGNPQQGQTSGLTIPNLYNISYYYGIPGVYHLVQEERLIGYFSDLELSYKNYLFVHSDFRKDYSSLLATGNNSYNVYGVDAAVVFTDMIASLRNKKMLSYGKIRAAYSHTGQITLAPFSIFNTFNVSPGYPYGAVTSVSLNGQYNNPANIPEATNEKEIGIELGFLNNRISGGATYYYDVNTNQLFPIIVTSSTGYTSANVNAANTISQGWEFDTKALIIKNKDFDFDLAANFSIQTTKVISLYSTGSTKTLQADIGNSNEAIVGMTFPQMYVSDLNRDPANGKVIVDGITGYPSLSPDLVAAGRTTPKYILGLTPSFRYKQFRLQIIADYRGGYVFYNNAEQNMDFTGSTTHSTENGRQNFIFPNSEILDQGSGKYVPNTNVYTQDGNISFWGLFDSPYRSAGTSYIENAAAWKVRTISLTYDFAKLISGQNIIKGAKLTALCNNVFMFRPKENHFTDPEFNYSNSNGLGLNTAYQLPPTRQYTLTASLKF
ncbi:MAG: SusC/RagA family TonB-linked outer membrane protein [Chitinophagales bacterium]